MKRESGARSSVPSVEPVLRPAFLTKGGFPVKFARACGGLAAVLSVGLWLALSCDHLAALLDAALAI